MEDEYTAWRDRREAPASALSSRRTPPGKGCQIFVIPGVVRQRVSLRNDPPDHLGITFRPCADDEEGGPDSVTTQDIQEKRGVHGVWAVVERQVYDRAGSIDRRGRDACRRVVQSPAADGSIHPDPAREPVPGRYCQETACRSVSLATKIRTPANNRPINPHPPYTTPMDSTAPAETDTKSPAGAST